MNFCKNHFYNLFLTVIICIIISPIYAQDEAVTEEMSFYELENQLVITATKTKVKIKDAPAAVYVITDRQIRERGYRTLSDALHDVPGFSIQHTCGLYPDLISQRGLLSGTNNRSLVYVDGILDNNINEGAMLGGTIRFPLYNIKRIEIIAGPASALYGANAFNGVINIITKDGKEDPGCDVQAFAGSFDLTRSENWGGGFSFSIRGSGKISEGDKAISYSIGGYYYKTGGPYFNGGDASKGFYWTKEFNQSWEDTYNITAKFSFGNLRLETINWQYKQGQGLFTNALGQIDTDKNGLPGSSWNFRNNSVSIGYLFQITNQLSLDSEMNVRHTELLNSSHDTEFDSHGIANYSPDGVVVGSYSLDTYSRPDYQYEVKERLQFDPVKELNLIFGFELSETQAGKDYMGWGVDPYPSGGSYTRKGYVMIDYQNIAVYAQGIYKPVNILSLTAGYRYDYNSIYGSSHTPRISAVLTPGDLTVKALFSTGFRAPNTWELYATTGSRISNPDLVPEKLISGELGVGYRFSKRFFISSQGYYNHITDVILQVVSNEVKSTGPPVSYWAQNQNIGDADVWGMEAQSDMQILENLNIYVNYTYSYGTYDLKSSLNPANQPSAHGGKQIPNIPRHSANMGVTFYALKNLSVNLRGNYVGDRNTTATNPIKSVDGYFLLHGNIRWEDLIVKGMFVDCMARNILNTKAWDPGVRTAAGDYYPSQMPLEGFNIWLCLGYKM